MIRRLSPLLLLLILVLAPVALEAQTWPRDVTGTTSAQCSSLDANGVPQLCSPVNPLPITGGALTGGVGTSAAGQNWFLSQPPTFSPFLTTGASSNPNNNIRIFCNFLDDVNVSCFGTGSAARSVFQWRSGNGGGSFTQLFQTANAFPATGPELFGVLKLPTTGYLFISSDVTVSPFFTTPDGVAFTQRTVTGQASIANPVTSPAINSATILAHAASPVPGVDNQTQCRSTDVGVSWSCALMSIPGGLAGGGTFDAPSGAQTITPVSAGIWLTIGQDSTASTTRILRSTNDGVSWTAVFNAGVAETGRWIQCLSSTLCLAGGDQRIYRSSNGGVTWAAVVTAGPAGGNTLWQGMVPFDALTAVVFPQNFAPVAHFYRTTDGGVTWSDTIGSPTTCPRNGAGSNISASVAFRNGRAIVNSYDNGVLVGGTCAYYSTIGNGGIPAVGPLGTAWNIGADGIGPVGQGNPLNSFSVSPVQGATLFNSQTTGANNTAVVVTIAAVTSTRAHVYRVEASCSAGTSSITITDGGVTVWSSFAAEVAAAGRFRRDFNVGITGNTSSAVVITLATCGVGNAGTLIVHADRF